jgi:hypothetical protein
MTMPDLENPEPEAAGEPVTPAREPVAPGQRARGAVLVGARIVAGTIGIVVAVVTVAAAGFLPLPSVSAEPVSTTVVPVPTDQQRVCAGPILRLGSDTGEEATTASSIGTPTVVYAASAGSIDASPLQSTDSTTGVTPVELVLPPTKSDPKSVPLMAGSQTQSVDHGDITGFAAAECREASGDTWLVGGSTTTGRTTLLTLSNPGEVIATVNLSIYTESGAVTAAGTDGIVVPPGGQRILSLAGFAPGATSPVVHVRSTGSQVVAGLQQTVVRTLEPGGVDVVGAVASPAREMVIPGLVLSNPDTIAAHASSPGYEDLASVLRFFVPGRTDAKAQITITPESSTEKPISVEASLDAGKVTETPLGDFPDGSYTVTVRSDIPVIAAARASVYSGNDSAAKVDFAWFVPAPAFHEKALVTVGSGPTPTIHLANLSDHAATVKVTSSRVGTDPTVGKSITTTVAIPGGGSVALPATSGDMYSISGFDQLAISVSYVGAGELASYTASPAGPASRPIEVYRH